MGDNHPDCSEIRVAVADDPSASLLQARLIDLGGPGRLVGSRTHHQLRLVGERLPKGRCLLGPVG